MDENARFTFLLVIVVVLLAAASGQTQDTPVRTTSSGQIAGFTSTADGRTVENYLGVPFAAPPTDSLRFAPPRPVQPWEGVRNASVFGSECVQTSPGGPMSEDCLYLNVYVPRQVGQAAALSVMVYIHGGAFQFGSASNMEGVDWLAAVGDVIVVTLNYRLNVFGFLSTGDRNSPGNFGLMDQRAAIVWVKDNIRNFGGDPDSITVYGLSAGSIAVSLQMLSPINNGLFSRVICESGTSIGPGAINPRPLESVRNLCRLMNCASDDPAAMVSELRAADPVQLTNAAATFTGTPPLRYWTPVVDGDFIPEDPLHILQSGALENRDVLLGSNDDEGGYLYEDPRFLAVDNVEAVKSLVQGLLPGFFTEVNQTWRICGDVLEALTYDYDMWNEEDPASLRRSLIDLYGDFTYVANTVQKADLYSKRNYTAYMYQFAHRLSYSPLPPGVGASHATNYNFIFPSSGFLERATDGEKNLMRTMMTLWSNFAKTGNPNSPADTTLPVDWPKYLPSTRQYLRLTDTMSPGSVLSNLRPKHTFFWTKTAPALDGRTCECQTCTPGVTSGAITFVGKTLMACVVACLMSYMYNHFPGAGS
ncbi:PREDICTED: carboxylesterase 5A-like [Branchiostoma belcheri]|uniref:Carboxylic ester hydrolase n=1 Tax=Branchiostoma belcheri TaxID=7741 RepID=A0A6P4Y282_BRABE|nr:PREDICTED: carboxylesterase 5A-like [Branchiostoma belcheri]